MLEKTRNARGSAYSEGQLLLLHHVMVLVIKSRLFAFLEIVPWCAKEYKIFFIRVYFLYGH